MPLPNKFWIGGVIVKELRNGLFRVLWNIYEEMDETTEYYNEFELGGTQSGRNFRISASLNYLSQWNVILKYLPTSDHSLYSTSQPENQQPKSKRPKVEEESLSSTVSTVTVSTVSTVTVSTVSTVWKPVPLSLKIWLQGRCEPVAEHFHGEWNLRRTKTLLLEDPFIEFLIDFGTNEGNEKLLINGVSGMFHNQSLCDIKFKFKNNEEIGAHVMILSARSPVFCVMLRSDFVESKTRVVNIADIEMEVFKQMLIYMYTGKAPSVTELNFTKSLYEVADKYCVEPLKNDCTNILISQLSNKNAIELLVWAQFQSLLKLFNKAMNFIVENCKELCFQPEWLDFMTNHPKLCLKINQKMAKIMFIDDGNGSASDSQDSD